MHFRLLFIAIFSLGVSTAQASAYEETFLKTLDQSVSSQKAGAWTQAACHLRSGPLKSLDGVTLSLGADLLKLLPATSKLPLSVTFSRKKVAIGSAKSKAKK